ncbi:YitT family protein [Roseburia sp. MUC/MUC-530-WT-4D]|uniref:YitT family protein n=1 Tax=Roseburia porci TaxID=2605790 RepID=A0A6L5YPQ0_9FIRM|nr:YitT family protein [Roseburia porci]MDD6743529.1 YitT family protein [Roseburia porci]MST74370.1 YitT family protein [Roseburia porci]
MSKTQKEKAFITAKQIFWEIIGSILIAIGVYNFAIHAEFPMTGFSGISIILYRLWSIPIGFSTILLNIPVAILCWKLLGKGFFLRSVRCTIISSVIIDYIAPLFPMYEGSRLLAALCTGVFAGLGYSLIYMQNSSTGGADFIIMAVKALRPHMGVGRISFAIDAVIIVLGTLVFRDVDGIIYGMIVSFLLATVIDKVMYGMNAGKMALIVTDDGKKICDVIEDCCQRGSTILKAQGGYQQEEREVVMCACNNKEMYLVQQAVKEADPASFMIVLESNEVHGEGFHPIQVGEKAS